MRTLRHPCFGQMPGDAGADDASADDDDVCGFHVRDIVMGGKRPGCDGEEVGPPQPRLKPFGIW